MDIENDDKDKHLTSSELEAQAFHTEDREVYERNTQRRLRNDRYETRGETANRAKEAILRRVNDHELRQAQTDGDIIRALSNLKQTYGPPLVKLNDANIYLRCVYYLWRIGRLKHR